jgi:hypothetical protein
MQRGADLSPYPTNGNFYTLEFPGHTPKHFTDIATSTELEGKLTINLTRLSKEGHNLTL